MEREIKFRGKRIDNGEWVYGFYGRIQNDDSSYVHLIKEDTTMHISNVDQTSFQVDPSTVGQYTGLKDYSGKDIYEGDILDNILEEHEDSGYVIYDVNSAAFAIVTYLSKQIIPFSDLHLGEEAVIGNIHDNPLNK